MPLINCPDCGTAVSSNANNCLRCGRQIKYWTPARILIGILMVVAVFGVPSFLFRVTVTPTYTPSSSPTTYSTSFTPVTRSTPNLSVEDSKILDKVKAKIEKDHPNDYSTQKYVYEEQVEAYLYMKGIADSKLKRKVERDHPLDFSTQKYVYDEQVEAKEYMTSLAAPSPSPASTPIIDKVTELFNLLGNKTFDTSKGVAEDAENLKAIKQLIKSGVDINAREPSTNSTLLMLAIAYNRPLAVKILLQNGADANAQNKDGQTALMYAAMHGNAEIAQLLIEKNANVNIAANTGITALAVLNAQHGNDFRSARFRDLLIKVGAQ